MSNLRHSHRTRSEIKARNCNQHMNNVCKDWLDPEKTKKFKTLVVLLAKEMDGLMLAYTYMGLHHTIQEELRTRITVGTAKKILNAYKKFKANPLEEKAKWINLTKQAT